MIRLFHREPWSLQSLTPPWGALPSIYLQIRQGVIEPLPDEQVVFKAANIKWIGGAMDGVLATHTDSAAQEHRVSDILSALRHLERLADDARLLRLYELVVKDTVVNCVDAILEQLTDGTSNHDAPRLLAIGRYLATHAGHREAVKFGLALMGVFGTSDESEIFLTLGRNEEFTLFAAVALARVADHPEHALWNLAKTVEGWGRIQTVRLLRDTQDPAIQDWLLREGFRNNVMDEYLACICARAGRLHEALNQQNVDLPLLDAAAEIIRALITGGPAEDIDDYEYSADACETYLNIVWSRNDLSLEHFLAVAQLRWFLAEPSEWEKRYRSGWTDLRRQSMQSLADDVVARDIWRNRVREALSSNDDSIFHRGDAAAQRLSIDTWELHFARVKAAPLTSSSWYRLMRQTDETRIDEVLVFAETVLPFDQIETGPADELGLGPNFRPHQALDWVLQDLVRFPNRGWRLIKAGLRSPVVSNRNMAINALFPWNAESLNAEMRSTIQKSWDAEPKQEVKGRLERLFRGQPQNLSFPEEQMP
jgi:hypothetical protein